MTKYTPRVREQDLHEAVVKFLRVALPREAVFMHIPNGEYRTKSGAARLQRMGVLPGAPDLLVFYLGIVVAPELKGTGGKLSPDQASVLIRLKSNGVHTGVCRSISDVFHLLRQAGIPLSARMAA